MKWTHRIELGSSIDSGIHLSYNLIIEVNYNNNLFNSKKDSEQVSRIKNDLNNYKI